LWAKKNINVFSDDTNKSTGAHRIDSLISWRS